MIELTMYLAGKFQDRIEIARAATVLNGIPGIRCISSWYNRSYPSTETQDQQRKRIYENAIDDFKEIVEADLFVLFPLLCGPTVDSLYSKGSVAGPESSGRYTELGYAIGKNRSVHVIGEHQNIFIHHPLVCRHADFNSFYDRVKEMAEKGLQYIKEGANRDKA